MNFEFPSLLPYSYDALEPYIDARTMEIHHTKHHQAYVNNLNQALVGTSIVAVDGLESAVLDELLKNISRYSPIVRNNAGGHFNHSFFWNSLTPHALKKPESLLLEAIEGSFGSFEAFQKLFSTTAATHFGSGWAWLSVSKKDGKLIVSSTANQDNPLMDVIPVENQGIPILGLDVWEHAYYLFYQNRRQEYIASFWNIINWKVVESRFMETMKVKK
ncbi:superoxide dismutase [Cardinium endosymbiont of Culicoides punctatus]|uniref:superoxide dismutase n=1 Tax=Cardinium endosymbiont of Culicoides punctatus TaxID=2304601 RepID=UPI001059091F|nr:superoxide dismutase [Cardinium endosymbiont of Culicoides punctatus]TDG94958.1 Superoxide dismutase [Mn] [Cardinium endosymbiont of Culicoides punctatus]